MNMFRTVCTAYIICAATQLHAQDFPVIFQHAEIHTGTGAVISNGMLTMQYGKITYIGPTIELNGANANTLIYDMTGKVMYPGMIALNEQLGLNEIELVRSTNDMREVGTYNPNVRSLIAFNTDSRVIPTVRSNGIALVQVAPVAGVISGTSSVMRLNGWNWEDAAVKMDDNMFLNWPAVYAYNYREGRYSVNADYPNAVESLLQFLREAKAYCQIKQPISDKNLRFEAMRPVFSGEQKIFISANYERQIIAAVDMAKTLGIHIVIVGGRESYKVIPLLTDNNIPVLLETTHDLPLLQQEDVDLPYKLPAMLVHAGVLVGLTLSDEGSSYWNMRNLPYIAGTAAAYGLTKEEALQLITINNAKLCGVDAMYGSLEKGKSATFFISEGDALDMRSSVVTTIYIDGQKIDPDNWQNELAKKYLVKYGIRK